MVCELLTFVMDILLPLLAVSVGKVLQLFVVFGALALCWLPCQDASRQYYYAVDYSLVRQFAYWPLWHWARWPSSRQDCGPLQPGEAGREHTAGRQDQHHFHADHNTAVLHHPGRWLALYVHTVVWQSRSQWPAAEIHPLLSLCHYDLLCPFTHILHGISGEFPVNLTGYAARFEGLFRSLMS